jgi:pimeloyl-ACP methyl ester carboxylesterase
MLHRQETGSGEPVVLVHGAWADGRHWTRLANELDEFRVITYDRRGHGRSGGRVEGIGKDVEDLVGLIEWLGTPAHVVGGSFGGSVALRLAATRPDLLLSLSVHEPALPGLLGAAPPGGGPRELPDPRTFAEQSLGDGAWDWLTEDERAGFDDNGEAYGAEMGDADAFSIDLDTLTAFDRPLLVTIGGASPPHWRRIAEAIPGAAIDTVPDAGHLPHLTHPREYARVVRDFASAAAAPR